MHRPLIHVQLAMADSLDLDFTEDEMYAALRLVSSEDDARRTASAFARAYSPGMDWGTSERTLLLLSLATETGHAKVERIRRAQREERRSAWLRQARERGEDSELADRWAGLAAAEEQEWEARRAELRRSFVEQGKLPPD